MAVCAAVPAADDTIPDPYQSLHPYRAIATLAALRQPLDAAPNDQRLLGLALMGYVNLCLAGEAETNGACGPWLAYARQLAARRAQARQGKPATTLADAAPELWVQALVGENRAVETALAGWPGERDTPHHRALHTLATGDWRAFTDHPPTTLHERYALFHAGFITNARSQMNVLSREEHDHNPYVVAEIQWRASQWGDPPTIVVEAVAATAWMLRGRELADGDAVAMLGELITACDGQPALAGGRDQSLRAAASACARMPRSSGRALGTAYRICDLLLDKERGVMGSDGKHRLFGLGDLAAWSRDRLYLAAFYGYVANRQNSYDETDSSFTAHLRRLAPDSVLATRYTLGNQGTSFARNDQPSPEAVDAAGAALAHELDRPRHHGDALLIIAINKLAKQRPDLAAPLLRKLLTQRPDGLGRAGLIRAVDLAADCSMMALVLPALRRAVENDPWDVELHDQLMRWSKDGHLLTFDGLKPTATWDDAQINNTTLPWPHLNVSNRFAIRWQGSLRIAQAGTYVVAVESDDDSRLFVGDTVVDNGEQHAMQIRQARCELAAGWVSVRLEYHQGGGQAGCRLLWQPPGADRLEPIPAQHLAHGDDHAPGLHAEGFALGDREDELFLPSADELTFARSQPWHLRLQARVGDKLFEARRYPAAIPFFTAACVEGNSSSGVRLGECQAWQDPPDFDAALATLKRYPRLSHLGWEYGYQVWRFRQFGRGNELAKVLEGHLGDQPSDQFLPGFAALDRVDLMKARECFGKIVRGYDNIHIRWTDLNEIRLHWAVLERLGGKEPDWVKLRSEIRKGQGEPWHELVLDYLSGAETWDACKARIPTIGADGEDLLYFRAWVDLTTGDHAAAKAGFADILARHPTWFEAPSCRDVLAWYKNQTEETLAKLPKAKPILPAPKAKVDNNDF